MAYLVLLTLAGGSIYAGGGNPFAGIVVFVLGMVFGYALDHDQTLR